MMKYDKFKGSNDIWLGTIPSHWNVSNLKHFVDIINGYAFKSEDYSDDNGVPIIRIGDISNSVDIVNSKKALPINLDELERFIIKRGDLLLAMTGATIGKNCMYDSDEICYVNQRVGLLRGKGSLTQSFLKYYIDTPLFKEFILLACSGSAQENISSFQVGNLRFALPPIEEQTQIAKFLDYQTGIIDALIAKKERLIDLLKEKRQAVINEAVTKGLDTNAKMKDSGIASFGVIPDKWVVTKLKHLSNVKGRIGFRGYTTDDLVEEGDGALALGATHITWDGQVDLSNPVFISWPKYDESPEIKLNAGDIIIVQRGSTCGKVAIISSEIGPATINPSLVVLKDIQANPFYIFLSIKAALHELVNLTRSSAIPMLSQEQIGNLQIVLPPIEEQFLIADFLEETKDRFDEAIYKLRESILKLKEYRESIISESVTGKIDVREWEPPNKNNAL